MLVKHRMTPNPITVSPDTTFPEAFRIIRERGIRYLPVLDKKGVLVGIITQSDLLRASPSEATTLTVFEMNYLLARLQVKEVMSAVQWKKGKDAFGVMSLCVLGPDKDEDWFDMSSNPEIARAVAVKIDCPAGFPIRNRNGAGRREAGHSACVLLAGV